MKRISAGYQEILVLVKKAVHELIRTGESVDLIYLHGSVHRQAITPLSDIDLAVLYSDRPIDLKTSLLHLDHFFSERITEVPVDIKILNTAPIDFCFSAISGELIFKINDSIRVSFETKVIKQYLDFKPIIDYYLNKQVKLLSGE